MTSLYKCKRCDKDFDRKCNYENHIKRKFKCRQKNMINDTFSIDDLESISGNSCKSRCIDEPVTCEHCDKTYFNKYNLLRHVEKKHSHSQIQAQKQHESDILQQKQSEIDKLQQMYNILNDEIQLLKKNNATKHKTIEQHKQRSVDNKNMENSTSNSSENCDSNNQNIRNNTANNVHSVSNSNVNHSNVNSGNVQNINIVQYGREEYPVKLIYDAMMESSGFSIPCKIMENIHFNQSYPEFHNICISDQNRKGITFWNGSRWIRKRNPDIGIVLLDKQIATIHKHMNDINKLVASSSKSDKDTFNTKMKHIDRLTDHDNYHIVKCKKKEITKSASDNDNDNDIDDDTDGDDTDDDSIESIKNDDAWRKIASQKIEEFLYVNNDKIKNIQDTQKQHKLNQKKLERNTT